MLFILWFLFSVTTYRLFAFVVPLCIERICCFVTGAMSFSASRTKIEPKKPSKKIGNLFSDAWKKGNVIEERVRAILVRLFYHPINPPSVNYSAKLTVSITSVRRKKFQIEALLSQKNAWLPLIFFLDSNSR